MYSNGRTKGISFLILIMMLIQMIAPLNNIVLAGDFRGESIIVGNMKIIDKKDKYNPGDTLSLSADWTLPEDDENKTYLAGDTFKIVVPKGLTPKFNTIRIGKYGKGVFDPETREFVFTFTEEVEGRINRKGGFGLHFIVDKQSEDEDTLLDLNFKDEKGNSIYEEKILVGKLDGKIVEEASSEPQKIDENLIVKGGYNSNVDIGDNMKWWVRVNQDAKSVGRIRLADELGEDQVYVKGSLSIRERYSDGFTRNDDSLKVGGVYERDVTDMAKIVETDRGFEIEIDISEYGEHEVTYFDKDKNENITKTVPIRSYFEIDYESIYIGKDWGMPLKLHNKLKGVAKDRADVVAGEGNLFTSGWGTSESRSRGKFVLEKRDKATGEALKNAKFKLTHKEKEGISYEIETDEEGLAQVDNMYGGVYLLEELMAPEGYEGNKKEIVFVKFDNGKFKIEVENNKKEVEKIDIELEKEWLGVSKSEKLSSIIIELYADGELVRTALLKDGKENFKLRDLGKYRLDHNGNERDEEIEYKIVEKYKNDIDALNYDRHIDWIKDNKVKIENSKKEVSIDVRKEWRDDREIKPTITLVLYREIEGLEKEEVSRVSLSHGELGHRFEKLDKYGAIGQDGSGIEWKYSVEELEVEGYIREYDRENNKTIIINKPEDIAVADETIDINIEKVWDDGEGRDRPEYIIVDLLSDGIPYMAARIRNSDDWKFDFTDLPKYRLDKEGNTRDEEIKYTIKEVVPKGYKEEIEKTDEGFRIKNTKEKPLIPIEPAKTFVKVEKKWFKEIKDGVEELTDGEIEKKNLSARILLYENDKEEPIDEVELNNSKGWSHTFTDLATVDSKGNPIFYYVDEEMSEEYDLLDIEEGPNSFIFKNEIKSEDNPNLPPREPEEYISIPVEKKWEDADGNIKSNNLPSFALIKLIADGKDYSRVMILEESNKWAKEFDKLPKYRYVESANGDKEKVEIVYEIKEIKSRGYITNIEGSVEEGFIVTNREESIDPPIKEKIDIRVDKKWQDENGDEQLENLPTAVDIVLKANGEKIDRVELNSQKAWSHTFVDLDKVDDKGKEIDYSVEEIEIDGYKSSISGDSESGYIISNKAIEKDPQPPVEEKIDIQVDKKWQGKDGAELIENLPASIEIILKANGENKDRVELTSEKEWSHTFLDLDKLDSGGAEIDYSVEEITIEGYESSISGDKESGYIITNKAVEKDPQPPIEPEEPPVDPGLPIEPKPLIDINVIKKWVDRDGKDIIEDLPKTISINLKENEKIIDTVELNSETNWSYRFKGLDKYDDTGKEINYRIEEIKVENYKSEILGDVKEGFVVTNRLLVEKPVEPVEPEPEPEPPVDPPVEPPVEPERPEKEKPEVEEEKEGQIGSKVDGEDIDRLDRDSKDDRELPETGQSSNYLIILLGIILLAIGYGMRIAKKNKV